MPLLCLNKTNKPKQNYGAILYIALIFASPFENIYEECFKNLASNFLIGKKNK